MENEELVLYLIKLSEGKLFLIKQLLTLTETQSEILEKQQTSKLDRILKQKQDIMKRIDTLDEEFVDKYDLLKKDSYIDNIESLQLEGKENLKLLQDKIGHIKDITGKIKKIDNINAEKLKQNMESVKNELKKVKYGKKVAKGYGEKKIGGYSIFVDKKK